MKLPGSKIIFFLIKFRKARATIINMMMSQTKVNLKQKFSAHEINQQRQFLSGQWNSLNGSLERIKRLRCHKFQKEKQFETWYY